MMQRMKIFLVSTLNLIRKKNCNLCSQLQKKKSCDDQFQSPSNHQNFKPVFFFFIPIKKKKFIKKERNQAKCIKKSQNNLLEHRNPIKV